MAKVAAGWYPDPTGRFDHRYWDGSAWTDHAARGGVQSQDPVAGGASVGPLPAMASPAGLSAPAATASRPTRSTKVKVLFLGGVPALIFGFFLETLTTWYEPTRATMRGLYLGTIGLIGSIALIVCVIVLVKTRQPGRALSRGLAWIALSVATIVMLPGTALIALVALATYIPLSFSDPFLWHTPDLKGMVKRYFEVWSWIGRLLGFHTSYGLATQGE
jgi:vacuolar-type H+-ATPase subunit I/STV1